MNLPNYEFVKWLEDVIDENGDLDKVLLNNFLYSRGEIDDIDADF
jgi:hypothetical protein